MSAASPALRGSAPFSTARRKRRRRRGQPDHPLLARHSEPGHRESRTFVGQAPIVGAVHSRDRRGGDARRREERRRLSCRMAARRAHPLRRRSGKRSCRPPPSGWRRNTIRIAWRCWPSTMGAKARLDHPALLRYDGAPEPVTVERPSRRLHALRQARRVRRRREPACEPRARSASISIRSAAGGAFAAAVRSTSPRAISPSTPFIRSADHVTPSGEVEARYASKRGRVSAWPAARLPGQDLRRSRRRRAARKPGPPAGRPQARRDASDRDRSGRAPLLRRGRRAGHARAVERSASPAAGFARAMGARRNAPPISRRSPGCRRRCARGNGRSPSRCARAATSSSVMPGFAERAFGVAIDVGSTTIAAHLTDLTSGEVVAAGRGDEPADPLRRRPDEPRLLRDDEPGRRQGADARGARGDGRADRRSRARGRGRARRNPGGDAGRQSDHASSRSRPRPDRTRRSAVRA